MQLNKDFNVVDRGFFFLSHDKQKNMFPLFDFPQSHSPK